MLSYIAHVSVLISLCAAHPPEFELPVVTQAQVDAARARAPTGPALSPDGKYLAYQVQGDLLVQALDETSKAPDRLSAPGVRVGQKTWSPDGRWLAFEVDADDVTKKIYGNAAKRWAVWDRQIKRVKTLRGIAHCPPFYAGQQQPRWTPDGRLIFLTQLRGTTEKHRPESANSVSKNAPDPANRNTSVEFEVWSTVKSMGTPELQSRSTESVARPVSVFLVALDLETGKAIRLLQVQVPDHLPRGGFCLSADGRRVAVFASSARQSDANRFEPIPPQEACVISMPARGEGMVFDAKALSTQPATTFLWMDGGGKRLEPLIHDFDAIVPQASLSPNGQFLAYAPFKHGEDGGGDVIVVDATTGVGRNMTERVSFDQSRLRRRGGALGRYSLSKRFGEFAGSAPIWTPDGKALYCLGEGDWWRIDLANGMVRNETGVLQGEIGRDLLNRSAWDTLIGLSPVVAVSDLETGKVDVLAIGHGAVKDAPEYRLDGLPRDIQLAPGSQRMTFLREAYDRPPELFVVDKPGGAPRVVAKSTSAHLAVRFPERIVVSYRTKQGRDARGVLYLPDKPTAGNKPPVILVGYPRERVVNGGPLLFQFMPEPLATLECGYAVYRPDLPLGNFGAYGEGPLREITDAVLAALDALIATDRIDVQRIGLYGWSYGGYMVNCVITQTDRFRAAVSGGGPSNLISEALSNNRQGMSRYEGGQLRMGASLWSKPDRYVRNSPVFYLDKVRTPLLLIHGDKDGNVPIEQSEEMYRGLEHLKKPVTFLRMRGKSHEGQYAWEPALAFFDMHLQGKPPAPPFLGQPSSSKTN